MIFIGIDPDVEKSGVAYWCKNPKVIEVQKYDLSGLFEHLEFLNYTLKENLEVRLEAGWLNKIPNYHKGKNRNNPKVDTNSMDIDTYLTFVKNNKSVKKSVTYDESIALDVGRNHEVGRQIEKYLIKNKINYKLIKPTKSKMKPEIFFAMTGIKTKDQEKIDAGALVYGL